MDYENPKDVAVGLLRVRTRAGVIRLQGIYRGKAGDDGFGKAALFGGWVNKGESIEQAVAREGEEELGLVTDPAKWRLLHSRHVPAQNQNLVFCLYKDIIDEAQMADAPLNAEVKGFLHIEVDTKLAFPLHEEAVQLFYSKYIHEAALLEAFEKQPVTPEASVKKLPEDFLNLIGQVLTGNKL